MREALRLEVMVVVGLRVREAQPVEEAHTVGVREVLGQGVADRLPLGELLVLKLPVVVGEAVMQAVAEVESVVDWERVRLTVPQEDSEVVGLPVMELEATLRV